MQGPQFDANQFEPSFGGGIGKHPSGKFPALIDDTDLKPTNDGNGNYLEVMCKTPVGLQAIRFNLWNNNPQTVEIAQRQLSALCHVTGRFRLNLENKAMELRGAQLMIEVAEQKGNAKYSEVVKLFDTQGNEPGKGGQQSQAGQQPNNNFQPNNQPNNNQPQPNNNGGSPWGGGGNNQPDMNANGNNGNNANNNGGNNSPWGGGGGNNNQPNNNQPNNNSGSSAPWAR